MGNWLGLRPGGLEGYGGRRRGRMEGGICVDFSPYRAVHSRPCYEVDFVLLFLNLVLINWPILGLL
jgi:hypothetical protein